MFFKEKSPSQFKLAEVIPINEAEDRTDPGNYGQISLISDLAKIFEKLSHSSIISFLTKIKIISKRQYGHKKGFVTEGSIIELN